MKINMLQAPFNSHQPYVLLFMNPFLEAGRRVRAALAAFLLRGLCGHGLSHQYCGHGAAEETLGAVTPRPGRRMDFGHVLLTGLS